MIKRPNSKRHLDDAIRRKYGQESFVQVRTMLANAIVAQMLPEGVIKGGTSLKMRFGNAATRYTTDLDAARLSDTEKYLCDLQENLKIGWEGFAGRLITKEPAAPVNVPTEYIMHPFEIKLSYMGKAWVTVVLEVGHNEIGDADMPDLVIPEEASILLHELGFPSLKHVPLMQLSHQIAQKLHALSAPGSDRIHDLVDLQIIIDSSETLNYKEIRYICERLFSYRRMQSWPPVLEPSASWQERYRIVAESLGTRTFHEAIIWANQLIQHISNS